MQCSNIEDRDTSLILYIFKIQWSWETGIRFPAGYFLVICNIGLYCAYTI